ncbi:MAG: hypothetical protein NTZ21_16050 [Actinobacteria bacterium]|nr:hypothetical protein [Actinomycetota bacterium]
MSDRAIEIDSDTGIVERAIRFPAPVRMINSDHEHQIVAVTPEGAVLFGDLTTEPVWNTSSIVDALAVAYPVDMGA